MDASVPATAPVEFAPDTFLIPNLYPTEPGVFLPVNSMLIRGAEPVIVDTGAPIHRAQVLDKIRSLVHPEDVRWIFLSHDDGDHTGSLHELLELCPAATLVVNFFITERLALEKALPLDRMVWLEEGDTFHAGDRTLRLITPPVFDGVTTRGLFDESTGAMWAVDSFAAVTSGAVHHVEDLPAGMYDEGFDAFSGLISPWHQWVDPEVFRRQVVDKVEGLGPLAIASAHGPILTGDHVPDAFDRVRSLLGKPRIAPPGPDLLEQMVAAVLAAEAPVVLDGPGLLEPA